MKGTLARNRLLLGLALLAPLASAQAGEVAAPSGYRAYVDPETGRLGAPPPGANAPASQTRAVSEPLVQVPGTTAGGGVMVDLGDRAPYAIQARVAADGRVLKECEQQPE